MRTVPTRIYQVNDIIATFLYDYLNTEQVRALLDESIAGIIEQQVVVLNGHDNSIPHMPVIVVESTDEIDERVAVGIVTQTHVFNITADIRRTQGVMAEQGIRRLATAIKHVLNHIIAFNITLEDNEVYTVWDISGDITTAYGYRQSKNVRAAQIQWKCKVDIPFAKLYGESVPMP